MIVKMTGIKINIIFKLHRRGKWGASHTSVTRARNGIPSHLWGEVDDELDDLIKRGFINRKPTGYGTEISLNLMKKKEIDAMLRWLKDNTDSFVPDQSVYDIEV